jgi:dihydrolipoamide dehydrogenase
MSYTFHTTVIGAGSGGLTVAIGLAKLGKKVALVERQHVGGDCTNVGCIPSKTLIHLAHHAADISPAEVLQQVRAKRDALRDEETKWVQEIDNLTFIRGSAVLQNANTVEITREEEPPEHLTTKNIVIASGSSPGQVPIDGLPSQDALTNESLFDLEDLPAHLAIVGAGIIGNEMAFAFRKLGSRVTLIDTGDRVLSALEPEVSELMGARLNEVGVTVHLGAEVSRFAAVHRTLYLTQGHDEIAVPDVDKVLLAVGRRPNVDGLSLSAAGVEWTKHGVSTRRGGQTNVPNVYAVGDVTPTSAFTHSANAQGRRLVRRLAFPWLPLLSGEPTYPSATFTDPEVAQVGPPLSKLQERYHPKLLTTLRVDLKDTDRGYTQGLQHGFILIHAVRLTGRVLSATVVAPRASEMISVLTLAVTRGISLYALSGLVIPYPALTEAIKKAADTFVYGTLPKFPQEFAAYSRYRLAAPTTDVQKPRLATGTATGHRDAAT